VDIKLIEIRDAGTFIPAMAIRPSSRTAPERYLMSRAGFGPNAGSHADYVFLFRLQGGDCNYDPYEWGGGARTMPVAHNYILANWDRITSGDVVCVEHILGERPTPKTSERYGEFGESEF
jgi:hypothetical protein